MAFLPGSGSTRRTNRQASRTQGRTSSHGQSAADAPRVNRRPKPKPSPPTPRPQATQPRRPSTPRRTSPPSSPPQRSSGPVEPVTPPPKPPSISQYLGSDDVYQQALRGSRRGLADFLSDIERRRGEAKTSFGQTQESLEEDRVRQLERMRDEFASRGLIHSGLYGEEQGNFQEAFQQQMQQLEQQQASLMADFLSQETDYKRESEQAREIAKQEALARRANRFDIPFNQGR